MGQTANFTLGGVWVEAVQLDHINFRCNIFGALVYNNDFADSESIPVGSWTHTIPFDVPKTAPLTTYDVVVTGFSDKSDILFEI
jgi:hypothetical protein